MTKEKCPMCDYYTKQKDINCEWCDLTMENLHNDIKDSISECVGRLADGKGYVYVDNIEEVVREALNESMEEICKQAK